MAALETAPGVIKRVEKVFITWEDVAALFECSRSKAYDMVVQVNKYAKKKGQFVPPAGKANKYLFSELYGIPLEELDKVLNGE